GCCALRPSRHPRNHLVEVDELSGAGAAPRPTDGPHAPPILRTRGNDPRHGPRERRVWRTASRPAEGWGGGVRAHVSADRRLQRPGPDWAAVSAAGGDADRGDPLVGRERDDQSETRRQAGRVTRVSSGEPTRT